MEEATSTELAIAVREHDDAESGNNADGAEYVEARVVDDSGSRQSGAHVKAANWTAWAALGCEAICAIAGFLVPVVGFLFYLLGFFLGLILSIVSLGTYRKIKKPAETKWAFALSIALLLAFIGKLVITTLALGTLAGTVIGWIATL